MSEEELERKQGRYRTLSPSGIEVELENLPDQEGVPTCLDSPQHIKESEKWVVNQGRQTDPTHFDALLPDCVLDPGVERLRAECALPVFGILELSTEFLDSLGHRFAAVTRNDAIGEELRAQLLKLGLGGSFDHVEALDLCVQDVSVSGRWNETLMRASDRFEETTTAVINGCSAVDVGQHVYGLVAIVDPTALALEVLGVMDRFELPAVKKRRLFSPLVPEGNPTA